MRMQNRKYLLKMLRRVFAALDAEPHPDFEARGSEPSIALSFQYDSLQVRILHSEESPPTRGLALVECPLGPLEPDDLQAQYEQLLDFNYRLCATNFSFAVDADIESIVCTCAFVVDGMESDSFIQMLDGIVAIQALWLFNGLAEADASAEATPIRPERFASDDLGST
jgi:hypothetical protein